MDTDIYCLVFTVAVLVVIVEVEFVPEEQLRDRKNYHPCLSGVTSRTFRTFIFITCTLIYFGEHRE